MANQHLSNEVKINDPEKATPVASSDEQTLGKGGRSHLDDNLELKHRSPGPHQARNPITAQGIWQWTRRFLTGWLLAGCPTMLLAFGMLWWYHEGESVLTTWELFFVHGSAQAANQVYFALTK